MFVSALRGAWPAALVLAFACVLSSCSGAQSALDPAGPEAAKVATLFYVMLVGGAAIWLGVVGTLFYAARRRSEPHSERVAGRVILICGAVLPVLVLGALLSYAVWLMPNMRPWTAPGEGGLRQIDVTAEQFWWRVRYLSPTGEVQFETANEIIVPVGERVLFSLNAPDVIHSFWIPALGGKMDAIPGRINRLALEASKPGVYRGVCAEFCGASHALMAFTVEALEPDAFNSWLQQRQVADGSSTAEGLRLFLGNGCGACHTIAGTPANGTIGPSLTALGARGAIAAGTLPNTQENIAHFIRTPEAIKPGVHMPSFGMLPDGDVETIAAYLKGLK